VERLDDIVGSLGAAASRSPRGGWVVRVPTARRGEIAAHLVERERTVLVRAFVMRGPDRAHVDVYRRLLGKNLESGRWRLALDGDGDVVAAADLERDGLDGDRLDGALGALSALVDEVYEGILHTGFVVPDAAPRA